MYYEDDQFFTRDDEIDYIEIPLEDFIREYTDYRGNDLALRCYIDGDKLEVDCSFEGWEFTMDARIDFRRIRRPNDLGKYIKTLEDQFMEFYDDIEADFIDER